MLTKNFQKCLHSTSQEVLNEKQIPKRILNPDSNDEDYLDDVDLVKIPPPPGIAKDQRMTNSQVFKAGTTEFYNLMYSVSYLP